MAWLNGGGFDFLSQNDRAAAEAAIDPNAIRDAEGEQE